MLSWAARDLRGDSYITDKGSFGAGGSKGLAASAATGESMVVI